MWAGISMIVCLVLLIITVRGAIRSDPMYQEIKLHRKRIKELKLSGQEHLIAQEEKEFNKRMRGLEESNHGQSIPRGFF